MIVNELRSSGRITYVTSSTGISACNVSGTTLHRFAGAGLADKGKSVAVETACQKSWIKRQWLRAEVLVIDEISMLSLEFFEIVDAIGRRIRYNYSDQPFGGLQLIITGDFCQLPPISTEKKQTSYCFESIVWKQLLDGNSFLLTQQFRQKEADGLVNVLDKIRFGQLDPESEVLLKSRCLHKINNTQHQHQQQQGEEEEEKKNLLQIQPTRLFSLRQEVATENEKELAMLKGDFHYFNAIDKGDKHYMDMLQKNCQAVTNLSLKVGAQVMLLKNLDVGQNLANGSRGVITDFNMLGYPIVKFLSVYALRVCHPETWDIEDEKGKVLASRIQIPLMLAWATTIHKSQGINCYFLFYICNIYKIFGCVLVYIKVVKCISYMCNLYFMF